MKSHFKKYIGIDPGKSGGIAVIKDDTVKVYACTRTVEDMAMLIAMCLTDVSASQTKVCLEKVWAFPTDGRAGSFTFGCNYGQWQGILSANELDPTFVTPKEWQGHFDIKKGLPKDIRKKILKQMAKDRAPNTKGITLKTADALLLAIYGVEKHLNKKWTNTLETKKVAV